MHPIIVRNYTINCSGLKSHVTVRPRNRNNNTPLISKKLEIPTVTRTPFFSFKIFERSNRITRHEGHRESIFHEKNFYSSSFKFFTKLWNPCHSFIIYPFYIFPFFRSFWKKPVSPKKWKLIWIKVRIYCSYVYNTIRKSLELFFGREKSSSPVSFNLNFTASLFFYFLNP